MYSLLFLVTVAWAWWEVGTDGWALVPRTVGPAVLLVCVILLAPTLRAYRHAFELPATVAVGTLMLVGTGYMMFVSSNAAAAVSVPGTAAGAAMSDSSLLKAGADWPAYGGSYSARRYSPLDQINPTNVSQLTRAWVFHTGDLPSDETRNTYGAETTPLKVGNLLYVCTPKNILIAVEASTGKQSAGATILAFPTRSSPIRPPAAVSRTSRCRMPIPRNFARPGCSKERWMDVSSRSTPNPANLACRSVTEVRSTRRPGSGGMIPACTRSRRRRPSFAASSWWDIRSSMDRSAMLRQASSRATMRSPASCAGPGTWRGRMELRRRPSARPIAAARPTCGRPRLATNSLGLSISRSGSRRSIIGAAAARRSKNNLPRRSWPSM